MVRYADIIFDDRAHILILSALLVKKKSLPLPNLVFVHIPALPMDTKSVSRAKSNKCYCGILPVLKR